MNEKVLQALQDYDKAVDTSTTRNRIPSVAVAGAPSTYYAAPAAPEAYVGSVQNAPLADVAGDALNMGWNGLVDLGGRISDATQGAAKDAVHLLRGAGNGAVNLATGRGWDTTGGMFGDVVDQRGMPAFDQAVDHLKALGPGALHRASTRIAPLAWDARDLALRPLGVKPVADEARRQYMDDHRKFQESLYADPDRPELSAIETGGSLAAEAALAYLAAGAASAPSAAAGQAPLMARAGSAARTAKDLVTNPLHAIGAPKWVGRAAGTAGILGPQVLRTLPKEYLDDVPRPVKDNLGYLRYAMPGAGVATTALGGLIAANPETTMQALRNYGENYGEIKSQSSLPVVLAKELGEEVLRQKGREFEQAAKKVYKDKIDQAREYVQRGVDAAGEKVFGAINSGLDYAKIGAEEALDLLNRGQIAWNQLPPELQGAVLSIGANKIAPAVFDQLLSFKYPDFDMKDTVEDVNDFYNRIVLPTKERFAGEPGKDYNAGNYRPDFIKDLGIEQHSDIFKPVYGWSSRTDMRNKVHMNKPTLSRIVEQFPSAVDSILVHEGTHEQNNDMPAFGLGKAHSGVSRHEQDVLDAAYGFDADMMSKFYPMQGRRARRALAEMEEATSNREFRRALDTAVEQSTGEKPNIDSFVQMIDQMSDDELQRFRQAAPVFNGYVDEWRKRKPVLDKRELDAWRKALKEVAFNGASRYDSVA